MSTRRGIRGIVSRGPRGRLRRTTPDEGRHGLTRDDRSRHGLQLLHTLTRKPEQVARVPSAEARASETCRSGAEFRLCGAPLRLSALSRASCVAHASKQLCGQADVLSQVDTLDVE
jgi:hypothetical protein